MRFRPVSRLGHGVVVGDDEIIGCALPQPQVLDASGRRVALDDVLGDGFALIAVDGPAGWLPRDSLWTILRAQGVVLRLDDRLARPQPGVLQVADADGALSAELAAYRGHVICVRPDRVVSGAFRSDSEAPFAAALRKALRTAVAPETRWEPAMLDQQFVASQPRGDSGCRTCTTRAT